MDEEAAPERFDFPAYVDAAVASLEILRDDLDSDLVEQAQHRLRAGLEDLDRVPRNDPFWTKTNGHATTFKAV